MKLYSAHVKNDDPETAELVHEGVTVGAYAVPVLWMLYHRMWTPALLLVFGQLAVTGLLDAAGAPYILTLAASLGINLLVGLNASDLRRLALDWRGYEEIATVSGRNLQDAERRFFDLYDVGVPAKSETTTAQHWSPVRRGDPLGVFPAPAHR